MDLVKELERKSDETRGRPPHLIGDVLKALVYKVYLRMSTGRVSSFIDDLWHFGYLEDMPSANTIIDYMGMDEITPILGECIELSASVLRPYETHFSPDSSGFRTTQYMRWCEEKYGRTRRDDEETDEEELVERKKREWRRVQIVVGANTHTVVAVRVDGGDAPHFIPMFERVTELMDVQEISGDGGYTSRKNYNAAESWGVSAYLSFDRRHIRPPDSDQSTWARAYRFQTDRPEEWKPLFHRRSNVETGFSSIKRLFDETVRSRKPVAQTNEILAKMLCHNLRVLIHEMFEMDIYPFFATDYRLIRSIPQKHRHKLLDRLKELTPHPHWPIDDSLFEHFQRPQPTPRVNGVNGHDPFGLPHTELGSGW